MEDTYKEVGGGRRGGGARRAFNDLRVASALLSLSENRRVPAASMAAKWGHADVPLADAAGVATGAGHAHPSGGLSAPEGSAACFFHADCRVLAQLLRRVTHEPTFQEAGALSL